MAMHPAGNDASQQSLPQQQQQMQGSAAMQGFDHSNPQAWHQQMNMMQQNQQNASADDNWSNSSNGRQNPIVPTTLNVEDWYVFLQNSTGNNALSTLYDYQQPIFPVQ